jgi:hypothetical protein
MTKLLEQAFAEARTLPEAEQDALAEALFAHISDRALQPRLTEDQIAEVRAIQHRLRSGESRLATEEETNALWRRCGL